MRRIELQDSVARLLEEQLRRVDEAGLARRQALLAWRADLHGDTRGDLEVAHARARIAHGCELESLAAIVAVVFRAAAPVTLPRPVTPMADLLDAHEPPEPGGIR